MSLLRVENLTLRFGGLTAVNNLDFHVDAKQIFSVIGPNGAGKTTVFNAITGVYDPSDGRILIEERLARRPFALRTVVGFVLVGLCTALGLLVAHNVQGLWEATITANYVYQQPFPWASIAGSGMKYLGEQPAFDTVGPLLLGALLGAAGAYSVWRRARRSPEVIARAHVARTFQNIRLFQQMTVLENVLVGMETGLTTRFWHALLRLPHYWKEHRESISEATEILRFVELDGEAHAIAAGLSYGHQRRLEIARALASRPKLLLLDEPAAGMNPSESAELMELIRKIRDTGVSVLLIEHHMNVVMGVSDRIVVLDYGNKIAEGVPDAIKADSRVKTAYLGTSDV